MSRICQHLVSGASGEQTRAAHLNLGTGRGHLFLSDPRGRVINRLLDDGSRQGDSVADPTRADADLAGATRT
jgi:hypothetical protein